MNFLERTIDEREQKVEGLSIAKEKLERMKAKEEKLPLLDVLAQYDVSELERHITHLKYKKACEDEIRKLEEQINELDEAIEGLKKLERYKEGKDGT